MSMDPTHSIALVDHHCEVHFAIGGFWKSEEMGEFLDKINAAALPLMKRRAPIYALGDFTSFVAQDKQTAAAISNHLSGAQKYGLRRIAVVGASALVTMQYRRLSSGLDVEFFETRADGVAWLRERAAEEAGAVSI